jgi:hypothetical protein
MGFGVLTGTMMATNVFTAAPASAHNVSQTTNQGQVRVFNSHFSISVQDFDCADRIIVEGQFKYSDGSVFVHAQNCGSAAFDSIFEFVSFRKCQWNPDGSGGCNSWAPT